MAFAGGAGGAMHYFHCDGCRITVFAPRASVPDRKSCPSCGAPMDIRPRSLFAAPLPVRVLRRSEGERGRPAR
jgi:hypothetical protein